MSLTKLEDSVFVMFPVIHTLPQMQDFWWEMLTLLWYFNIHSNLQTCKQTYASKFLMKQKSLGFCNSISLKFLVYMLWFSNVIMLKSIESFAI